jgi:hypothetical protein
VLVKVLQYPNYFIDRAVGTIRDKTSKRYGWNSSQEKKAQLLGLLRRAYAHGGVINHSAKALDEALTYVSYDDGGIGPAEFTKESADARMTHGDRVIADALMLLGVEELPASKREEATAPGRSLGFRRRQAMSRARTLKPTWGTRIDFSSGTPEFTVARGRHAS